jgi:hypothetical protein
MNSPATARPPGRRRLALIAAGALALLGSFVVTAPAQAGYYEDSYYRPNPCSYRCGYGYPHYGYQHYGYAPYRYRYGCSTCGSRPSLVYERRYVEREFVERRYGYGGYRRHYGCYPYGGCRHYGYYPYGGYRRPYYPYGYGGVGRRWPTPYGYGYQPSADTYEEPPRPPAPVLGGTGYEGDPYGYEN